MRTAWSGLFRASAMALALAGCGGAGGGGGGGAGGGATVGGDSAAATSLPAAMRPVTVARGLQASPDHALIVVLSPSDGGPYAIVDASGAIVAEVGPRDRALIDATPGTVTYYALADSAGDRISGEVVAGGVYYAAVDPHGSGIHFVTVSPRSADGRWDHLSELIGETEEQEIDPAQRGALDAHVVTPQLRPRMSALDTRAGEMDAAHLDERTLHPEEGSLTPPQ
ncbi:MAG: hypothetical protein U0234_03835 [Sandaracinus sp.]